MSTPIRPPNIPPALWRQMSPEDQQAARIEYFGPEAGPPLGGYAEPAAPAPAPSSPRQVEGTKPAPVVWAFVRSLNSFPGNHPYFDADRAAGIGGYMLEAHDPWLESGAAACRAAGFRVGVWADPHGADPQSFAGELVGAAHRVDAEAIGPDPESTGKGYAGSPGWQWNAAAAAAIRALDPGIPIAVLPIPFQDDFNYGAWVDAGAVVWVQAYGATLDQVYDPAQARDRVVANGVPIGLVTVILPAGSLPTTVAQAQAMGLPYWAIYTIDDVGEVDRSIPFGANDDPYSLAGLPPSSDDYGVYGVEDDDGAEYGNVALDPALDDWLDEFLAADLAGLLDEDAVTTTSGLRFLAAAAHTPGGAIHNTDGLVGWPAVDFPAKPGTILLAPEDGIVRKFSGHDPRSAPPLGVGGPWGWSLYFRAVSGHDYFITHLRQRNTRLGAFVFKGEKLGEVGDYPGLAYDHAHIGTWDAGAWEHRHDARRPPDVRTASGRLLGLVPQDPHDLYDYKWYGRPSAAPLPVFTPAAPVSLQTVKSAWNELMHSSDSGKRAQVTQARTIADRLLDAVK